MRWPSLGVGTTPHDRFIRSNYAISSSFCEEDGKFVAIFVGFFYLLQALLGNTRLTTDFWPLEHGEATHPV